MTGIPRINLSDVLGSVTVRAIFDFKDPESKDTRYYDWMDHRLMKFRDWPQRKVVAAVNFRIPKTKKHS